VEPSKIRSREVKHSQGRTLQTHVSQKNII